MLPILSGIWEDKMLFKTWLSASLCNRKCWFECSGWVYLIDNTAEMLQGWTVMSKLYQIWRFFIFLKETCEHGDNDNDSNKE